MSIRNWLITKLGGYTAQTHIKNTVVQTQVPIIRLKASTYLSNFDKENLYDDDLMQFVREHLIEQLGDQILKQNLLHISTRPNGDSTIYEGTLNICKGDF